MTAYKQVYLTCDSCQTDGDFQAESVTAVRAIAKGEGWVLRSNSKLDLCPNCHDADESAVRVSRNTKNQHNSGKGGD